MYKENLSKGEEMANDFSNFVNSYNFDAEGFVSKFSRTHNALQQQMMKVMFMCIERAAEDNFSVDGRNQASSDTAKLMMKGWKAEFGAKLIASGDAYWTKERVDEYFSNDSVKPSNLPLI